MLLNFLRDLYFATLDADLASPWVVGAENLETQLPIIKLVEPYHSLFPLFLRGLVAKVLWNEYIPL